MKKTVLDQAAMKPSAVRSSVNALDNLREQLGVFDSLAVAVSGGVDSMTLAWVAGTMPSLKLQVVHAVSPAVPGAATDRVRSYAAANDWSLQIIDAGEYHDPQYRRNPVNRCFYCKSNLYQAIRHATAAPIAAGTNLDDLGDYRPGLLAADEHRVHHPFVQASIDKAGVRRIAAAAGLDDIAQLPAQPCLASRVETGIAIDAQDLAFIDQVEKQVAAVTGPGDIRCRITAGGVRLELSSELLGNRGASLDALVTSLCEAGNRHYAGHRPYQMGSAFLVEQIKVRTR